MNRKIFELFSLFQASLVLLLLISCGSAPFLVTVTPAPTDTLEILTTPVLETPTPPGAKPPTPIASSTCAWENWPCASDSLTLTAEMGATFAAIPNSTNSPWATIIPSVGDLGWGSVYGRITNGATNDPIDGATVRCEHFSYTSPYLCNGITTTNSDGIYAFTTVFFHDTDRITLIVEAPGYIPLRFEPTSALTRPEFHADLGLFPVSAEATSTPTPYIMCTPPACSGGVLACGDPNGCPGGCGTVCSATTPTP